MFNFILHSYIFKRVLIATAGFLITLWILNKIFDVSWKSECCIPVKSLDNVYKIPFQYDNTSKLNIKLGEPGKLDIEANKRFIINGSGKESDFYDTINILNPDSGLSYTNKIYLYFENKQTPDSVYMVISKSNIPGIYWNQIFYSSVRIENLNKFSDDTSEFRINPSMLVGKEMLFNNDSLINEVINYFNLNRDNLGIAECGTNCIIFKSICDKFSVPCRTIGLQGGDATETGYNSSIGYPIHVICEVYSSMYNKWYVLDPSYGTAFLYNNVPLNAVEISNRVYFSREAEIVQDSVLTTRKFPLNSDYFRYYENVYYDSHFQPNFLVKILLKNFYGKYTYGTLLFSNKTAIYKNAEEYLIIKSSIYFILIIIYINIIFIILAWKLLKSKKCQNHYK